MLGRYWPLIGLPCLTPTLANIVTLSVSRLLTRDIARKRLHEVLWALHTMACVSFRSLYDWKLTGHAGARFEAMRSRSWRDSLRSHRRRQTRLPASRACSRDAPILELPLMDLLMGVLALNAPLYVLSYVDHTQQQHMHDTTDIS